MREALEHAAEQHVALRRRHLSDMHGIDMFEVYRHGLGRLSVGELEHT